MSKDPADIEAVFFAARQKPPADRAAYLDEVCGRDSELRRRVEQFLSAQAELGSFLEAPVPALTATVDDPVTERPGTVIGPYKLLEQIGEGGFGVVFMAEQTRPVRRKVALKVLKPGMDTRQVIARFEAERQALALMDHANIAHVLDGGETAAGRPYFVMELVRGVPITAFCDQNQLSVRARLGLFISVCQAVQHAHQKGVIHRDIKPSNVLVTLLDGTPVVKVIDFGIAKATGQQLTDRTLFTNFAQMIGTPLYMSPEQAQMSALDVDTRTDIYALGVLLYELLTGTTPFDKERFGKAGYDEIRRIIREEEPPRPSTRMSTLGQAATIISTQRQADPKRLSQLFRGELDWIVMKALEKDRNRRYETASSFTADVQRYLHDEPVQACPPSALYRFGKFARRNKAALLTAAAVAGAVLLAVAGLAVSYAQIKEALVHEKQAHEREQQALYFQRIATAAQQRVANELGRVEESLDECPSDLRGWEWHYLKRRRYEAPRELLHPAVVLRVAYSGNGWYLAAACLDGTVQVWDTRTWQPVHTWKEHHQQVYGLALSPVNQYLAAGGNEKKILVWNLSTGALLYTLEGHTGLITQLAFSPDSRRLASVGWDQTVRLWEAATGAEVATFQGHAGPVLGVAFRPDGRRLASCGGYKGKGEIKIWDTALWGKKPS